MLQQIIQHHNQFTFICSDTFMWSPSTTSVHYDSEQVAEDIGLWSLLHELGHALLSHNGYQTDLELIKLERAAWQKATELAEQYEIAISEEHIEDCMDTYREWLKARSTCPRCSNVSLQSTTNTYQCFNCQATWQVSRSPLCRVQRRIQKQA
jgi:hypothetical protein